MLFAQPDADRQARRCYEPRRDPELVGRLVPGGAAQGVRGGVPHGELVGEAHFDATQTKAALVGTVWLVKNDDNVQSASGAHRVTAVQRIEAIQQFVSWRSSSSSPSTPNVWRTRT